MIHCPTDSTLTRLIADTMAADEQSTVEAHLNECAPCRLRLDALAEVSSLHALVGSAEASPLPDSAKLRLVMEQLLGESRVARPPAAFAAKPSRDVLPALQPTARLGFIGRLGDIDIRRVIGRGGMGVVFEGEDRTLHRTVAVKVLSPHLVGDGEAKARFLREAQAAAALFHENVVAIHAIDEADGMPYLVLQYVAGESLAERLARDKKLPFEEVVRLGLQTARGLAAAHGRGLIHRDIKPANLLLDTATGAVRITDFGLAKHAGLDSLTEVGAIAGTPAYMSPEQTVDGELDARSDLFSLGVVLYEASSGAAPFRGDSPFVVLNKIRMDDPRPVGELNPELPAWFGSIVHRLLEKDRTKRIGSAAELAELLERQAGIGPAMRSARAGSRRRVLATALVTLVGLVIAAAIYFRPGSDRISAPSPNPAPIPIPNPKPPLVGFVVAGIAEPFPTLADAVQAAPDDGVIDIHGDGPFPSPTIVIEGKSLTVRAAPGATPRFIPDAAAEKGGPRFLIVTGDLRLEGVEVIWPIASSSKNLEDLAQRGVISIKGNLTLSHCRIVAGPSGICVGSAGSELVVRNCHCVCSSGACIASRAIDTTIRVEHCCLEGKFALLTPTPKADGASAMILFTHNTVDVERLIFLPVIGPIRKAYTFTASHNLINGTAIVAVMTGPGFSPAPNANAKLTETVRQSMSWHDEANVYTQRIAYLIGNLQKKPALTVAADLKAVDPWLAFWKQPGSKSIDGNIRFAERTGPVGTIPLQLKAIDAPSGPIPPNVGADAAMVGPGAAYHAHRAGAGGNKGWRVLVGRRRLLRVGQLLP